MGSSELSAEMAEIWALFAQEAKENIALAEQALLALEQTPSDMEEVKVLFRGLHSFKGGARMMGLTVVESLAHHAEDIAALVRDEGVALQEEMIELLLAVLDHLRAVLIPILENGCDVAPEQVQEWVERLQEMAARYRSGGTTGEPESPASPVAAEATPEALPFDVTDLAAPVAANEVWPGEALDVATAPFVPTALPEGASFPHIAEHDLSQLHAALDAFAAATPGALAQVVALAQHLQAAAEQRGYDRLAAVLEDLEREAGAEAPVAVPAAEAEEHLLQLQRLELTVFEELTRIQDSSAVPDVAEQEGWTDIAWLFRHWNAERVFADLERLSEIADALQEQAQHFSVDLSVSGQSARLAEEATVRLGAIYHSCVFYHLDTAVHLTLALEDLFARIVQGELTINDALTALTRAYIASLGSAIDAIREGETPELGGLAELIKQAQNFMYLHIDGPVFQVTRSVLDILDLPADFKEVMTPETMMEFSQALQAGERFYTVLADLERDEALSAAFLGCSGSEGVRLITNTTVYRYNRTLFNFLFATTLSRETLLEALVAMDPQWEYLTLRECSLREEVDPRQQRAEKKPTPSAEVPVETAPRVAAGVSMEILESMVEALGTLVADHATLQRVVGRLSDSDLVDTVLRIVKDADGEEARAREQLQAFLAQWSEGLQTLGQMEAQMGVALVQLQDTTRALRLAPVAEMLTPLRRMVQELAQRQGKMVELSLQGSELDLDRGATQTLGELLRRLVWFAVTQGIEDVERRRAAGKPAAGRILIRVTKNDDHVLVVVEDDGQGLDREAITQRARQLGWLEQDGFTSGELGLVLRSGFGIVGGGEGMEGIDLAAIQATLHARHGRLAVRSNSGLGTSFEMRLPLDMAVVDGIVVRVGQVRYVVPVNAIRRIVKADAESLVHSSADGAQTFLRSEGALVQVQSLSGRAAGNGDHSLLMVVEGEHGLLALSIDELLGQQQVLVRPLEGQLADVQQASGCALLGEGEMGMVLDLASLGGHNGRG